MSVTYGAVGWNRAKKLYDLTILAGLVVYLALFMGIGAIAHPQATFETLAIRALATAAFLMLHLILSIGPLARLNPKLLPLLYNRRHLGVATFLVAVAHALFAVFQFHAQGNVNPVFGLLTTGWGFQTLGLAALMILFVMAATSHDFWLANLTPRVWKALHMSVYVAYALIVLHVALGALRSEPQPLLAVVTAAGMVWLLSLHVLAARREAPRVRPARRLDRRRPGLRDRRRSGQDRLCCRAHRGLPLRREDLGGVERLPSPGRPARRGPDHRRLHHLPVARLPVPAGKRMRARAVHREGGDLRRAHRRRPHLRQPGGASARDARGARPCLTSSTSATRRCRGPPRGGCGGSPWVSSPRPR
jgi:DMSO/TMAO reductase YedYZ heme-binding membrane subunit